MKTKIITIILLVVICVDSHAKNKKRVLFISSYNSSFPTFFQQIEGVKSVFDTANVIIDVEFMDSKRFVDTINLTHFFTQLAYKINTGASYDGIITSDDNALNFVVNNQNLLFGDIPIVFCGVNNISNALNQNKNKDITGIVEAVSMQETLELMQKLFPDNNEVYCIVDNTNSGQGDFKKYQELASKWPEIKFQSIQIHKLTFDAYIQKLSEINRNTPVLLLSAYYDKNGKTIDFYESLEVIKQHLPAPLFHLWHHGMGQGIFGGMIISHYEQGKEAAKLLHTVLHGNDISKIKVRNNSPNIYLFDYNELKQFQINTNQLPIDSNIINQPISFYAKYKLQIHATLAVFVCLIIFIGLLLKNIFKRHKAEKELRTHNLEMAALNKKYRAQNEELVAAKHLVDKNAQRFEHLFENNPVSLWEEDFYEVKTLLAEVKQKYKDLKQYLINNSDFVNKCASLIKITRINNQTLALHGYKTKEEIIQNLAETFNEVSQRTFINLLIALSENQSKFIAETEYLKKDGSIISAILHVYTFDETKKSIVAIVDTTALKKAEQELSKQIKALEKSERELKKSNTQLLAAKEKAETANQLKNEFLQNMSHEVRTPLNGIIGFAKLVNNKRVKEEKRKLFTDIIVSSSYQLLKVIDAILEISILAKKQLTVVEEEFSLNKLLRELYSIFELKTKEKGIALNLILGLSDNNSIIITDKTRLNKVLSNLIENAIKFTTEGFVNFGYKKMDGFIELFVKDSGIGISEENQKKIFERFTQEDKQISDTFGGLGLGLAISKENTQLIGGTLVVESKKGEGATFTVRIPYKTNNNDSSPKLNQPKTNIKDKQNLTILIAEDDETNFLYIQELLIDSPDYNFQILRAVNGKDAVNICMNNHTISLVLMDMKMPVLNGFNATKEIIAQKPDLPIIAVTAYTSEKDKQDAKHSGCIDFVTKPIEASELHNKIKASLNI